MNDYERAGDLVLVEDSELVISRPSSLPANHDVAAIVEEVLREHPLPFPLKDFQKHVLYELGNLNNVILTSPTGSGKMLVAYLAIRVLKKRFGKPSGVGLGTQPLSAIMNEKLKSKYIRTGTISMTGSLQVNSESDLEEEDVSLSAPIDDFKTGKIDCIFGHAESWVTEIAKTILDELQEDELIVFTFLDEAHIPLFNHWNTFRPHMKLVPGQLRGRTVRKAPCLAMTATLIPTEVNELMKVMGFREENTAVIKSNPVQEHHKFIRLVIFSLFSFFAD